MDVVAAVELPGLRKERGSNIAEGARTKCAAADRCQRGPPTIKKSSLFLKPFFLEAALLASARSHDNNTRPEETSPNAKRLRSHEGPTPTIRAQYLPVLLLRQRGQMREGIVKLRWCAMVGIHRRRKRPPEDARGRNPSCRTERSRSGALLLDSHKENVHMFSAGKQKVAAGRSRRDRRAKKPSKKSSQISLVNVCGSTIM